MVTVSSEVPAQTDARFVGWLASRVKAATGSGLFVVCGQNTERGGVFDYYGVLETVARSVQAVLERLGTAGSLDGAVMRVVRAAPNARIGPDTVFCFDLDGPRLSARYGGGAVAEGWLVGVLDPATSQVRFHYLQVGVDGSVAAGESVADLTRSEDGRWQLTEHFTWSSGEGSGTNQLQETNAWLRSTEASQWQRSILDDAFHDQCGAQALDVGQGGESFVVEALESVRSRARTRSRWSGSPRRRCASTSSVPADRRNDGSVIGLSCSMRGSRCAAG